MTTAEKLKAVADNIPMVYNAGKDSAYNDFWDKYQQNGTRGDYSGAFAGAGWTNETFKPKYDIICSGSCNYMFYNTEIKGDLELYLNESGIELDFSNATSMHNMFANSNKITHIGDLNITKAGTATSSLFAYCSTLAKIDKLIVNQNNTYSSTFVNCLALKGLRFEGEIAKSGLNLQWSDKLSAKSIASVVEALSSSTSGLSITLSETAVINADWSTTDYTSWDELADTKSNWTITLI